MIHIPVLVHEYNDQKIHVMVHLEILKTLFLEIVLH